MIWLLLAYMVLQVMIVLAGYLIYRPECRPERKADDGRDDAL